MGKVAIAILNTSRMSDKINENCNCKVEKTDCCNSSNVGDSNKKQKFNLGDTVYMITKPSVDTYNIRVGKIYKQVIDSIGMHKERVVYNSLLENILGSYFYEEDVFLCKDEAFEKLTELNVSAVLKYNSNILKATESEFNDRHNK